MTGALAKRVMHWGMGEQRLLGPPPTRHSQQWLNSYSGLAYYILLMQLKGERGIKGASRFPPLQFSM